MLGAPKTNILYKYREDSPNTERIISEHELWLCSPTCFNDPFDCWSIIEESTNEQKREWISQLDDAFIHGINRIAPKVLPQQLNMNKTKEFTDAALASIRVCCFSKNCNNILMWSHYAKEHTGMCFMFDVCADLNFFSFCGEINYVAKASASNVIAPNGAQKLTENCILAKYEGWRYEEEVRKLLFGDSVLRNSQGQAVKFNPQALKKIIFGCRTSIETINKYISLCNENGMQHVGFSQMRQMADGTFGLKEENLNLVHRKD